MDDSELLTAVRSGDASSATALYERIHPTVARTVRRLLGANDVDFDDAVQVALVEVVTTIDRYRGESSLDSWVSMLAARVVYKRIRRRKLERLVFDASAEPDVLRASQSDVGEGASHRELINRVHQHLNQLEPTRAWAFLLHDVWGYDLKETASILDVSVAAAQSRVIRGRRDIHERIGADTELRALFHAREAAR